MTRKTIRRSQSNFRLFALAILASPCGIAMAQPAWYTAGVGGFNPDVPKFYQHQDAMSGVVEGANGWEPGGGWCGWVAYDDIFYALTKQGYKGLYQGATDPTLNNGSGWYAATYGAAGTDQYFVGAINNSGSTADSLSVVFTGTGGSVNNVGTPPPGFNGAIPAGTTTTLNGPVNGANGFSLNFTPQLPKKDIAGAFFTASPGIQFNSGTWTNGAANVAVNKARDLVTVSEGATNASVVSSDIYNIVQNLKFNDVQTYLNNNVNNNAANNGQAALMSGTWNVDKDGNVDYLGLQNGKVVNYGMAGVSAVTFTRGVMAVCNGQEVIRITQGNLNAAGEAAPNYAANTANGQGLWWAAPTAAAANAGNYHMLAVSGINVAGNQLYVADPDSNPTTPAGATGVAQANGGWPSDNENFPGNAPFNFKTPASADLPVPTSPTVGAANSASWNQLYSDFSFASNGTYASITSAQSPQYNGCQLQNLQTIMKNPFKVIGAAGAGAGKVVTAISVALPADAATPVDQILIEPSQQALDPGANPGLNLFDDSSEPGNHWGDFQTLVDPFGNTLDDNAIDFTLLSGAGLAPGQSALIDIGTNADFASLGYDILVHYEPNADNPNGFWVPYLEQGSLLDPSGVITDVQQLPEPGVGMIVFGVLAMASRRKRA